MHGYYCWTLRINSIPKSMLCWSYKTEEVHPQSLLHCFYCFQTMGAKLLIVFMFCLYCIISYNCHGVICPVINETCFSCLGLLLCWCPDNTYHLPWWPSDSSVSQVSACVFLELDRLLLDWKTWLLWKIFWFSSFPNHLTSLLPVTLPPCPSLSSLVRYRDHESNWWSVLVLYE